jgi:hypothetical protein
MIQAAEVVIGAAGMSAMMEADLRAAGVTAALAVMVAEETVAEAGANNVAHSISI